MSSQWIERLPYVREVMGSIPVGYVDISLSHARVMLNNSSFTFLYRAQHSPSKFTYQKENTWKHEN